MREGQDRGGAILKFLQFSYKGFVTFPPNNSNENMVALRRYTIVESISNVTKGRRLFKIPMPEAIFLAILSICTFHDKFSST